MTIHDGRCEGAWNDGLCACPERAENASLQRRIVRPKRSKIARLLALHK